MLDPKFVRENPEAVKEATRVKRVASPELVDQWLAADERRRSSQTQADALRAEQGKIGGQVGKMKRDLKGGTSPELDALLSQAGEIKGKYEGAVQQQADAEAEANTLMLQLPAIPDPAWPKGKDAEENVVVRTWAAPDRPPLPLADGRKDHVALGHEPRHSRLRSWGETRWFAQLRPARRGALLYNAVLRYAQDVLVQRGYEPFVVPVLVTEQCMIGTGYFPAGRDQAYVTQDGNVLVGTSEVPLASFHGGEILDEAELPKKFSAYEHLLPPRSRRRRQGHGRPVPRASVRQG
jgi:seryl-tRNA synthetase